MRAYVCELDLYGLRRVLPEDLLPTEELFRLSRRPTAAFWALLGERDAEELRTELGAGRHRDALGLLLDRAVELLPLVATRLQPGCHIDMAGPLEAPGVTRLGGCRNG